MEKTVRKGAIIFLRSLVSWCEVTTLEQFVFRAQCLNWNFSTRLLWARQQTLERARYRWEGFSEENDPKG